MGDTGGNGFDLGAEILDDGIVVDLELFREDFPDVLKGEKEVPDGPGSVGMGVEEGGKTLGGVRMAGLKTEF